jgi:hypothetical protein
LDLFSPFRLVPNDTRSYEGVCGFIFIYIMLLPEDQEEVYNAALAEEPRDTVPCLTWRELKVQMEAIPEVFLDTPAFMLHKGRCEDTGLMTTRPISVLGVAQPLDLSGKSFVGIYLKGLVHA